MYPNRRVALQVSQLATLRYKVLAEDMDEEILKSIGNVLIYSLPNSTSFRSGMLLMLRFAEVMNICFRFKMILGSTQIKSTHYIWTEVMLSTDCLCTLRKEQ